MDVNDQDVEQYLNQLAEKYGSQLGNFPEPPNKDTLLQFMRDVIKEMEALKLSKSANFRDEEVGKPKVPVLTYVHLSQYAGSEGYDIVEDYLLSKVTGVAALSLGRKAKLLEVLFTVRRETKNFGTPKTTVKKSLFGGEQVTKEGVET